MLPACIAQMAHFRLKMITWPLFCHSLFNISLVETQQMGLARKFRRKSNLKRLLKMLGFPLPNWQLSYTIHHCRKKIGDNILACNLLEWVFVQRRDKVKNKVDGNGKLDFKFLYWLFDLYQSHQKLQSIHQNSISEY